MVKVWPCDLNPASTQQHPSTNNLVHLSDERVDVGLTVTEVTALDVVLELPLSPAASGVGELERPEEVGCLDIPKLDYIYIQKL